MKAKAKLTTATSTLALAFLLPATAQAAAGGNAVAALPTAIDMDTSAWRVDRSTPSVFENVSWQGRTDVIHIGIAPPSTGSSFRDWQGYHQQLNAPAGPASLSGDLWIDSNWVQSNSASDYIRTGIWGSTQPEGQGGYVDSEAVFPIISFTNKDGVGRLEVWDTTANPEGGWRDLGVESSELLKFGGWNRFEMRVLPNSDTIDYLVNGISIYTWTAPRGDEGNLANDLWGVYLKPRNNGTSTFDNYWSNLTQSQLITDGSTITSAPNGLEIVSGGVGTVTIAPNITIEGGVTTGGDSAATLVFENGSGIQTTGTAGVISAEGSPIALTGGTVTTNGASAHGLLASGQGSAINTQGTNVVVTGSDAHGAAATSAATINLTGGIIEASSRTLSATGGTITSTGATLKNTVATNNGIETGIAYALDGGSIIITGGSLQASGGRNSALFAFAGGTITSTDAVIQVNGDRSRGVYAGADSNGGGAVSISGGTIATNGVLSHGLFTKLASGSAVNNVATISAKNVGITVNGTDANGIYADVGGIITVTGGTVVTLGTRGVGLHAQANDDELTGAGLLSTTNVTVTTVGSGAYGGYAEKGGQLTLDGGSISTTGASAYGFYARDAGSHIASSADVTTGADWTFGVYARDGADIDLTDGTITTNGFRAHGLLAENGGTISSAADITTHGDRGHGVQAGSTQGVGSTITLEGGSVTTTGSMAYGLLAYNGSIITGTANVSTTGEASFGVSADGDGIITLVGGSVTTFGAGSHGFQSVRDDRFADAGVLSATNIAVSTAGTGAYGALADEGGSVTLTHGSITTTGTASHGLVVSGPALFLSRAAAPERSILTATDLAVRTTGENAAGAAIIGSGMISLMGGSIESAGPTLLAQTTSGSVADFAIASTTLSSSSGVLLQVDRTSDAEGEGRVQLSLSNGTIAQGDIIDAGSRNGGQTNVSVQSAILQGALQGVDAFSLSGGAIWNATGNGGVASLTIGEGGATINALATTVGLGGPLLGNGALTKGGNGTLVITGDNSDYTGHATVISGRLLLTGKMVSDIAIASGGIFQIGDGTVNGDLTGSALNDGTMIFDQIGDYDYVGALSGGGSLVKRGEGMLLLSGDYAYTGSTVVEGGLVRLASQLDEKTDLVVESGTFDLSGKVQEVAGLSGASGTVLLGDGALTVNQDISSSFGGNISGSGSFTKTGAGTLNLTGQSSFTGAVAVESGRLAVNGTLPGDVNVTSGGTLGGNGTIASAMVSTGGIVAPGNSIGTLHVTGNVTFTAGSVYQVEVDAAGNGDKIIATGTANIQGGKVSVLAAAGNYRWTNDYVILSAASGVNGSFSGTDVSLPFLTPSLVYSPTEVVLVLTRNDRSFASAAVTSNQRAVATALDASPQGSDLYRAVSAQSDETAAIQAFDALSGELWATTGTFVVDQSRRTGELVLGRLQQADAISGALANAGSAATQTAGGTAIWGQAIGSWNRVKGNDNASRASQDQVGFITGLDTLIGSWRIGAAFGYDEGKTRVDARGSAATIRSKTAAIYASGGWSALRLRAGASYGWHDIAGSRLIAFQGFSEDVKGAYDGTSATAFGELSYAARFGRTAIEPFAGINYVHVKTDAFVETGASAALGVDSTKRNITFSTLGLRLGTDMPISDTASITPRLAMAWQHGFGDIKATGGNNFSTGQAFSIDGLPAARNTAVVEAGAQANVLPGGSIGLSYVGNIADRWSEHGIRISLSYSF